MNKHSLFNKVTSIILITVLLLTSLPENVKAASKNTQTNTQTTELKKDGKDLPTGKKVKNKKPVKLTYGVKKKHDVLEQWKGKKEILEDRTSHSKTYLNEDGSKTTLIFSEPIHVMADKNASENAKYGKNDLKESKYLDINNTLMPVKSNGKTSYKNTFGLYDVTIPDSEDEGIQMKSQGVSLTLRPLNLDWESVEAEDNQAYIPSKSEGITYLYTVGNTGLKEDIVINHQMQKAVFTYDLDVNNQYDVSIIDNIIYVVDKKDKNIYYTLSAPYMSDREENVSTNIKLDLEKENGKYKVIVTPDQSWLDDPYRAYPVVIDPTVQISQDSNFRDTFVESRYNYKQFTSTMLYVGYDDGITSGNGDYHYNKTRSYIKFNLPDELSSESTIESATLHLHAYTNWSNERRKIEICKPLEDVAIPSNNASVGADCVTWSTQPSLSSSISSQYVTGSGNYSWNIMPAVTSWLHGATNTGLALKMEDESKEAIVFNSSRVSEDNPYVEIKYDSAPLEDPISDEFKLVLDRDNKYDIGSAYAKNELTWSGDMNEEGDTNRATITYTLMPDGITDQITKKNFSTFPWETKHFDLEKDKAYWIKATVKVDKWVQPDPDLDGNEAPGYFEEAFTKELTTKKFVVGEAQPGDTLRRLSKHYLNDATKYDDVYSLNKLSEERLFVGQKLFFITNKAEPYNYNQPETITDTIMTKDAAAGTITSQTETVGQYINPVTGAFQYDNTDFSYPVYNNEIEFTRSYVSTLRNRKSALGDGWDYSFDQYLMFYKDGKIGYNRGDGSRIYFSKSGTTYTTISPVYDSLVKDGDYYKITTSDKTVYTFSSTGLLTRITDMNQNATSIDYDENDWQNQITDALDRSIQFTYYDGDGNWMGNIREVKLPDASTFSFDYDAESNNLITYSDREGHSTDYTYNEDGKLENVTQAEGNTIITNRYLSGGKVYKQTDGENSDTTLTYNGSTTTVLDGRSLSSQYQYDTNKRIIKKIYPDTKYEAYEYNAKGDVLKYTDRKGRIHQYTYNSLGYTTTYIRPEDQKTISYEYKDDYLQTQMTDFKGNKTTMTYDANNNLDQVIEYDGAKQVITDYDYESNGLLDRIIDPDGVETRINNSSYPDAVTTTSEGVTSTEHYDKLGRTISYTDGNGNTTNNTYDRNGNLLSVIYPSDGQNNRSVTYTYDRNDNLTSSTGSRLMPDYGGYATTTYTYDNNNEMTGMTDPYGETTSYTYDGNGNLLTETDTDHNTTTYNYDSNDLLAKVYDPGQTDTSITYEYDALGNTLKETEADGDYTEYQYDYKVGQVSREFGASNYYVNYTYDDMGNLLTESEPDSRTSYVYDSLYQTVEIQQSGAAATYITYTPGGRQSQVLDEKGVTDTYNYEPGSGQLSKVTEILNNGTETKQYSTSYTYDSNGNIATVTDKKGNLTTYHYNELNEVSQVTDPMNKVTTNKYDEDGNLSQTVDGEGNVTDMQYDALGNLYRETILGENTTYTYLYDSRGNLKYYIDPTQNVTTYQYDSKNRMTKVIDAKQQVLEYQYNQDDTLSKILYPNGETEEYAYDGQDRSIWYKDRSSVTYNTRYTPSGNIDFTSDSVGNHEDYRYDSYGRLTQEVDTIGRITSYTYDQYGRQVTETGYDGNVTTYSYDPLDRVTQITDPEHKVTGITYDALGNTTRITKPGQRVYTYDYDPSGNLSKVTDPLGNATQYKYNCNNEVSEIINARGFSKRYQYNALNMVESVTDERNYTTKYNYYPGGLLKNVTDPLNNTTSYAYDALGQVSSVTDALNETVTYAYDFFGNPTRMVDSRGVSTSYTYNSRGQLLATYDTQNNIVKNEYYTNGDLKSKTDQEGHVTQYIYDAVHRITKTVEPNGLIKNYAYQEPFGDLQRVNDNAGQETTYTYDRMHRLLSEKDIQGLTTTYTYDDFGNMKTKTTPDGNTTTYGYDELDRVTSILDPENKLTQIAYDPVGNLDYKIEPDNLKYDYTYDPANNLEKIMDPQGQLTNYTYDGNNNMATMQDPSGNRYSYQYDALNRLATVNDLCGTGNRYQYDSSGNLSSLTDGNGNTTTYHYNNLNNLEAVTDGEGNTTKYTYNKDGSLASMTDARGNTSTYSYDAGGNLAKFTNPLGETTQYNYNLLNKLDNKVKADANNIRYNYDEYNRLESIVYPDNTSVKYTYDSLNRKISMEDENGLTEYAYDDQNRLVWVCDPNDEQVSYEYDDKGRKTAVIYPDGKYVEYAYDEYDRIIGVNDREGRITRYTYDEAGRKKTTTLPNGITTTYTYDEADRITGISSVKEDGTSVLKFQYQYDNASNRTLEEIWQGDKHYRREYTYYKNNTIRSMHESGDNEVTYTYSYDGAGNISEKSITKAATGDSASTDTQTFRYTYDSANRMVTEEEAGGDTRTYRYDANGNRTARVLSADSTGDVAAGTTDGDTMGSIESDSKSDSESESDSKEKETADYYYYDYEDRLVEIVIHSGKVFTYGYDGEGNRLWRTYSQYSLIKPPVEEGDRAKDQSSKSNKDNNNRNKDTNNNNNNNYNNYKDTNNNININRNQVKEAGVSSLWEDATTADAANDIMLLAGIQEKEQLLSAVDNYLTVMSVDKYNNGNGNGNDKENGSSNGNNSSEGKNNSNGNNGNGNGGSNSNGNGNSNGNSNANSNGNGNGNSNANGNGSKGDDSKGNNGNGQDDSDRWINSDITVDQDKAHGKTKEHYNRGYDKNKNENGKGNANGKNKEKSNNGKHKGWYKNGKIDGMDLTNPEIFEVTNYVNDINQDNTEVLMTTDVDENYRGVYTYANGERISEEDLGQVEGVPNDPLYYLSDALGSTVAITNMNGSIIDNNRFAPYGEPLSPVAKNSRLTNSPWGYTGESHDIEAGLVYLRARYYEPGTGRFIQQDSYLGNTKEPLSRNLYAYGMDNPILYTDPTGHWGKSVHIGGTMIKVTKNKKGKIIKSEKVNIGTKVWATKVMNDYLKKEESKIIVNTVNLVGQAFVDPIATTLAQKTWYDEQSLKVSSYVNAIVAGDQFVDEENNLLHKKYDKYLEKLYYKKENKKKVTFQEYDEVFHGFKGHKKASDEFITTCYNNAAEILKISNYSADNISTYITNYITNPVKTTLNNAIQDMETNKKIENKAISYVNGATLENVASTYNPNTYFNLQVEAALFVLGMGLHTKQDESAHVTNPHVGNCDRPTKDYINGEWKKDSYNRINKAKRDTMHYITTFLNSYGSYLFTPYSVN